MNPFAIALSSALAGDVRLNLEGFDVICRKSDGFVNVTAICNAYNSTVSKGFKEYNDWVKRDGPQDFLIALYCDIKGISREELEISMGNEGILAPTIVGARNESLQQKLVGFARAELERFEKHQRLQATWVHPQLAIAVAQWVSAKFAVRVSKWIYELFVYGSVHSSFSRSSETILEEQLRQMSLTVAEKDSTISRLELQIAELKKEIRDSSTVLLKEIKDSHVEISHVRTEAAETNALLIEARVYADAAHHRLVETQAEVAETKAILLDVASRAVPVASDPSVMEVFLIFCIGDRYTMRGVQAGKVSSLKREIAKKYGERFKDPLLELECAPNSIMLKSEIRVKLGGKRGPLKTKYSDMEIISPGYTEAMLISDVRGIHASRY